MKSLYLLLCSIMATSLTSQTQKIESPFKNPLPIKLADPYIMKASNGTYYLTGTGEVRDERVYLHIRENHNVVIPIELNEDK